MEYPAFVRVYRALPESGLDYAPHPASRTARQIAWGLAEEVRAVTEIIETGESRWRNAPAPATAAELTAAFERHGRRLTELSERLDDATWASPGRFLAAGQVVFEGPIRDHCFWILFDGVHHRGQLSTYLRPMGGKVPAIYGPSGDEAAKS
ncbi:MAG: DinB family protein [Syntrophomonadaceae bacterium]